jgi:hypothetical protein
LTLEPDQERNVDFQISALYRDRFSHLFGQNNETLENKGIRRIVVDTSPGYPCRVSLQDAAVGETVLLMNYEHQPADSPFRSSHAIYVREDAAQARPDKNRIPDMIKHRLLSVRAFDAAGMIIDADVIDGDCLESLIERMLANESADYLHVHNARLGCYLARVDRGV